ncbi:DUF2335 domain-containing protein [uncultured Novosphingobium sp.]|uniref:DUF2335 domain-containing protein n=1 Tax=uncultured Novosphingobium sp. TaxID=292277 RepID=UPI0025928BC3|nr:DUF2335 domain-containing protein [uncultured Novosphingobium sp.]
MAKPPARIEAEEQDERLTVEALEPLFRPEKRDLGIQIAATIVRRSHRGPLPSPDMYAEYEAAHPGSAERIMQMAEREQVHRHSSESRMIRHEYGVRYTSQIGAIAALVLLCATVAFCAWMGQQLSAAVIGAVGAIVIAFLRYTQIKLDAAPEREEPPAKKPPARRKQR